MPSGRAARRIEIVANATPEIIAAVERLMAQLTSRYVPDAATIASLVSSDHAELLVARELRRGPLH